MSGANPIARGIPGFRNIGRGGRGRGLDPNARGRGSEDRGAHTTWRGRGASIPQPGQRGNFQSNAHREAVEPLEAQAKGELLSTIELDAVKESSRSGEKAPSIHHCEYVASYNLLHHKHTTILVPGAPRAWTPPTKCPELRQDRGFFFKDMIEAKWPEFPMEPGIRAAVGFCPAFDAAEIDLVTCATVLENLLRFLAGTERSFRFNVELVGDAVFFVSKGTTPREGLIDVRGYGHTYPEAYTTWADGLEDSICHQRLIKYDFGRFKCLVQFKADGYLEAPLADKRMDSEGKAAPTQGSARDEASSLATQTEAISLSAPSSSAQSKLRVQSRGMEVPQSTIFELKTRSTQYENSLDPILLRLWLIQVPTLILARHTYGKFEDVSPQDMSNDVRAWERKNRHLLEWLHALLRQLIDVCKKSKDQKMEVRRIGEGPLEVRRLVQSSWSALPEDLKVTWRAASGIDSEGEGDDDYLNF